MATPSSQLKQSTGKDVPHTRVEGNVMFNENYEVGKKIGEGSFGKVYEAVHKVTGIHWAIKSLNKDKLEYMKFVLNQASSLALKQVEREVSILKKVSHPHIVNLNEVIESSTQMYLVMELCTGGELADVLKERGHFTEAETKIIMTRLCEAISYLHKHGIVHRDLKLENILLAENPDDPADVLYIKVGDFGLSVVMGGVTPDNMMQDVCGTPIYMAPEILENKTYSQQCDVWAMGVIMYTLFSGHPPFCAKEQSLLYELIRQAEVKFTDEIWKSITEEAKNCICRMLKVDPAHRISAAEVLDHPWITGATQDANQPTNVLEMMRMWKDELKNTDEEQSVSADPDLSEREAEPEVTGSSLHVGFDCEPLQDLPSKSRRKVPTASGNLPVAGSSTSIVEKRETRKKPEGKHPGVTYQNSKSSLLKAPTKSTNNSSLSIPQLSSHQWHKSSSGAPHSVVTNISTTSVSNVKNGSGNGSMKGTSSKGPVVIPKPKKK